MIIEERKKIILDILNGSSTRLRYSYFLNNHFDIFNNIINFCVDIDIPFNQKIWHWVNDKPTYYLCKCGNRTNFNKNWLNGYKIYCSSKCSQSNIETKEKRKLTNIEKYGVDNVAKLQEVKKKQEDTNLKIYGSKSSFQNKDVREKWKRKVKEKYNVDHIFQLDSFKEKSEKTSFEKYGVSHYVKSDEYIKKTIEKNREKYGEDWYTQTNEYIDSSKKSNNIKFGKDYYSQTEKYKDSVKKTNIVKYNVDWYYQSDDFKEKSKISNLGKYGSTHYTKSEDYKNYVKTDEYRKKRLDERISFYNDRGFEFISSEKIGHVKLKSNNCLHEFDIHPTNLQRRNLQNLVVCTICNPIDSKQSGQEVNVINWIQSLYKIDTKVRDIIKPYELDIYIPDKKIAIEYNGLYWHSEIYKDKKYHLNKMMMCEDNKIDLIQIWEDDWLYRNEIIKSIIKYRIGIIENKIFARNCKIEEIKDRKIVNKFFDDNHIQGSTNYNISIGLFNNDILVSCMLFNKPKKEIELVRFCNKINTVVIGSASKLFKHFVKNNNIEKITSFADRSMFDGNLYEKLGFKFIHRTPPNYWWVVDGIRKHRFTYNKQKLIKMGYDPLKTEVEIMHELGNYRIYGCGQDKWIWSI